ncbi:hypothetical protein KSK37_08110 [Kaistella sp. DKR-2]|uniref:hypothetical protein n=1 Tax=Kaistella soli TaxID=2849654 RepID=UPI001C26BB40|nr:hypothetical protein [Kaistella soli]MBU8883042.1 hypothetical protein [Kaistella soli]
MDNKITTYSALFNLVDIDTIEPKQKDIAKLFLNAMNDWPTYNQKEISDFIKELKDYFGNPLTIEKISAKKFNGQNAWQIEAGSSIADLINISTKFYNESDFDKIVENFLNHYSTFKQSSNGQETNIDQDFCQFLEYEICKAFEHSDNDQIKGFWCDGILLDQPDSSYSPKYVNDNRQVKLKAFIGKDGQDEYELILKFGNKALSRYARNLDIKKCVPSPDKQNWFNIDTERNKIEIQLD